MRRVYRGSQIEVSFDLDTCIHIGECIRRLPEVFALDRRPWISPDGASADEIAAVVERCPSGALQYQRLDGGPQETGPEPAVEVCHDDGTLEVLPRATLCRCGGSLNKPFCDNTHLSIGFRAPGEVFHIELSPVRHALDRPMTKAEDPRGA